MTKKHFEQIAKALKAEIAGYAEGTEGHAAVIKTAYLLASEFQEFNPNFRREQFLQACGA